MRSVGQIVAESGLPRHEAQRLLECATGMDRVAQIAHPERILPDEQATRVAALIARRLAGEPLAYMLGEREFWGLAFKVGPAVLIPRADTELVVELALARLPREGATRVRDLGTGSGAIAVAIAFERPEATVTGVDISAGALSIATENAARHGANIRFVQGNWFEALADGDLHSAGRFEIIVSNPPYIADGDPHLLCGDLPREPQSALVAGIDGLTALRAIAARAKAHLVSGGWLLLEHGFEQGAACSDLLAAAGFTAVQTWPDIAGLPRVTGGRID